MPDDQQNPGNDSQKLWDDADFDSAKAKSLVTNLRADIAKLKEDQAALVAERDGIQEKLDGANTTIEELQATVSLTDSRVQEKEAVLLGIQTLREKEDLLEDSGLPRSYAKYVQGEDSDSWKTAVAELAELRGAGQSTFKQDPAQAPNPPAPPTRDDVARTVFSSLDNN